VAQIFISHASVDRTEAAELLEWLRAHGFGSTFLDFDDERGIAPGEKWESTLYREISACDAVILILTENWFHSKWCFVEFAQARALGKAIFPLVETPTKEKFIGDDIQLLDLVKDREGGLDRLRSELTRIALNARGGLPWDNKRPPYPGLMAYAEADAAIYFGRDDDIRALIQRLEARRVQGGEKLVVVLGASGAGKSSLLRAGVAPRLKQDQHNWIVLPPFRPQAQPLDELALAISTALGDAKNWRQWRTDLGGENPSHALIDLARDLRAAHGQNEAHILITIDQGEELFGSTDAKQTEQFFAVLNAMLGAELPYLAAMALRSDYLGHLQQETRLEARFEQFSLKPMPLERVRDIVLGPAKLAGITVDDALVTEMMADARTDDALPLLAFALRELYDRSIHDRTGGTNHMTVDAYRAMGDAQAQLSPLENAVRRKADEVLGAANPTAEDLQALKEAFIPGMVRVNPEGEYVRRAADMSKISPRAMPMIERLAKAYLLAVRHELGVTLVEVTHEALLRKWPRLKNWLDEEKEFLTGKEQLDQDLADWEATPEKQKTDALLWGLKLARAQAWLTAKPRQLNEAERRFIDASTAHVAALRRREMVRTTGALAVVLCLIFSFVIAYQVRKRHDAQAAAASARMAASETDFKFAATEMMRDEEPVSLAYLADAMRKNPGNQKAIALAVSELRNAVLPLVTLHHGGGVQDASFSPDGAKVVTASEDRTAQVWDATTGQKVGQPMRHAGWVHTAEFSPDGAKVVTASWDGTARVWDARTGTEIGNAMQHDVSIEGGRLNCAHFSADGAEIVTASWDHTARVWDATNPAHPQIGKALVHQLPGAILETVWTAVFNPKGAPQVAVTASADHEARLWDLATHTEKFHKLQSDEVNAAVISPDGRWVVTVGDDSTGYILDARSFQPVGRPLQHERDKPISYVAFSPDSRTVVTASYDKTARLWDVPSGNPIGQPMPHADWVEAATFSADSKLVVTASYDRTARVWDGRTGQPLSEPMQHSGAVYMARFSPTDSSLVVTASFDHTARIWKWNRVAELPAISGTGALRAVCLDASAERMVTVTDSGTQIWNARTGQAAGQMAATGPVTLAACSRDGTLMFTASGKQGQIRNAMTGAPVGDAIPMTETPNAAVFDTHNRWLAVVAPDQMWLWDAATGRPQGNPIRLGGDATGAVFSGDGSMIATWSHGGTVRVWNVATGATIGKPMIHQGEVKSANFSPDGRLLVVSSTTGHATNLWTVQTGAPAGVLQEDNWVPDAEFSPDGRWVATSSGNAAQVWDVASTNRVSQLMQEKDTVLVSTFSPNSKWVLTASQDGVAQVWDALTGVEAGRPIKRTEATAHSLPVRAAFTSDGKWILTAWQDVDQNEAPRGWEVHLQEAPIVTGSAPAWLIQLAEIAGGEQLDNHGVLQPTPSDEDSAELRQKLLGLGGSDAVDRFGKWLASDPRSRVISPLEQAGADR
jgi:WD40 repeat protein/type II secretory pathway predicted ATPase ExeA